MTEKEMKKLSRAELLEMLIAQSIELENCKEKLNAAEVALKNREIAINRRGLLRKPRWHSAASLMPRSWHASNIPRIFACSANASRISVPTWKQRAAQSPADRHGSREEEKGYAQQNPKGMRGNAQQGQSESQQYWEEVSGKLQTFLDAHTGLRELLAMVTPAEKQE